MHHQVNNPSQSSEGFHIPKIIIFDLDDTLYDEESFVISGFKAVAQHSSQRIGVAPEVVLHALVEDFRIMPRGKIFDRVFSKLGSISTKQVSDALSIYRSHKPDIELLPGVREVLKELSKVGPLYLVTDGNKAVQWNKIVALKIESYFSKIFITHRFGISAAKPSLKCFEMIKKRENVDWAELVYVGDDPTKDFVSLNEKGSATVRVHQGRFKGEVAFDGFDGKYHIDSIPEIKTLLAKI
jgi:putative hydrolase of the HAD superfamily